MQTTPGFLQWFGGSNTHPHVCEASSSPTAVCSPPLEVSIHEIKCRYPYGSLFGVCCPVRPTVSICGDPGPPLSMVTLLVSWDTTGKSPEWGWRVSLWREKRTSIPTAAPQSPCDSLGCTLLCSALDVLAGAWGWNNRGPRKPGTLFITVLP